MSRRRAVEALLAWLRCLGRHELRLHMVLAALALALFVFMKVASEVREGEAISLDRALLLELRNPADLSDPIGPRWLEEMGRDFTALGGVGPLVLLNVGVVGYLLLARRPQTALFVAASTSGAAALSVALKSLFVRARPELVPHLSLVDSSSFPSGHSMLAATVYLTLGALLARVEPRRSVKAYLLSWALVLAILVGLSRVYVGVHWPSDVLAGWAAGAAWAALSWLTARALQRRGALEATGPEPSGEVGPR